VYTYATGTFASHKVAAKLHEDVAFRLLGAENFPAHRTIAEFRQHHLPEFRDLFVQGVRLAGEVGLVKPGTVAVDGSKGKANASQHKAMSYGRMKQEEKRLRKEIREQMGKARKRGRLARRVGSRMTKTGRASPGSLSSVPLESPRRKPRRTLRTQTVES
jgi:hypothetical protein